VRGVSVAADSPTNESPTNMGVIGVSESGIGVYGACDEDGGVGGYFFGGLIVTGAKSAAVPHPDGSHRLVYCMESPDSWFEDFGRAVLADGQAQIALDPDFAAIVETSDYHVFLSPEGENSGLYVSHLSPAGFEVHESHGGQSNIAFSYRIVARRRDIRPDRLAKTEVPRLAADDLRRVPDAVGSQQLPVRPAPAVRFAARGTGDIPAGSAASNPGS